MSPMIKRIFVVVAMYALGFIFKTQLYKLGVRLSVEDNIIVPMAIGSIAILFIAYAPEKRKGEKNE